MNNFVALMYHTIGDQGLNKYETGTAAFYDQLAWLKNEGFIVEGFDDLEKRLTSQEPLPERYTLVTFDDGHISNLVAAEALSKFGFSGTFFITKNFCSKDSRFVDEDDVRKLAQVCSVGSHTVTHGSLIKMPPDQVMFELKYSKEWLENVIGKQVVGLSAPGGSINASVAQIALKIGYDLIGNSLEWWNRSEDVRDTRLVNRIVILRSYSISTFARIMTRNTPFYMRRRLRYELVTVADKLLSAERLDQLSKLKSSLEKRRE